MGNKEEKVARIKQISNEIINQTQEISEQFKEEKVKVLEKEKENLRKENEDLKSELDQLKQKLKKYNLPEVTKLERYDSSDEEADSLFQTKLKVLKSQFIDMNEKLDKFENINDLEKLNNIQEKIISNKSINIDSIKKYCGCFEPNTYLCFNFNIIGILFVTVNLIGVNQLISILNSTKEEMIFGIKSFVFAKNRTHYFPENIHYKEKYENYIFNNIPDFNLLFLSSILGNLMLKGCGYRFSSIIFMVINTALIFIVRTFDFPDNYNIFKLLLIMLYYFLLFLSIGSIALFSPQIYFDGLTKYYTKDKKENNKIINENDYTQINIDFQDELNQPSNTNKKEKPTFFFYLCFTEIPAYLGNLEINYFLKNKHFYNNIFDIFINSIIIYGITTILSIILYSLYSIIFIKNQPNQKEEKILIRVYKILGYIIYCEKKEQGLIENKKKEKEKEIEKEKEKEKENKNNLKQPLFLEDWINNEDENKENEKKEKKKQDYLKNQKDICCYSCKLGAKKFLEKSKQSLFPIICCGFDCCCKCCFKCCCCYNEKEDLSELNQGDEQFCYCYKIQRKISWFCDLLFKEDVLDFIFLDILNDLLTIGFQKKMKKNLKDYEMDHNLIILFFIIYFFILAFLNKIYERFWCNECFDDDDSVDDEDEDKIEDKFEDIKETDKNSMSISIENKEDIDKNQDKNKDKNQNEKKEDKKQKSKEYSKAKLGLGIVLLTITNFFITTIFSGFSIFGSKELQNFTSYYLVPFPLALNKFYIFLLMNCLLNIMDNGNIDILSNSAIISIFLMVYNLTTFVFTDLLDIGENALIIFQFSFGFLLISVISLFIIIQIIDPDMECLDSCCERLSSFCEYFSSCCESFISFCQFFKYCCNFCCCICDFCCCNDE